MRVRADRYRRSPGPSRGLTELDYPFHDGTAIVTACGRICYEIRKLNLGTVFAGQTVVVAQVSEHIGLVAVMDRRNDLLPLPFPSTTTLLMVFAGM